MRGMVLAFRAIFERLDRIDKALGFTEPTPAQAEYDAWADEQDSDDEGRSWAQEEGK